MTKIIKASLLYSLTLCHRKETDLVRFFSLILFFSFTLQISGKLIICINYQINKEFIINNLCENRSKPKMHCDGKCQLKKELDQKDNNESPVDYIKEKIEVLLFSQKTEDHSLNTSITGIHFFPPFILEKIRTVSFSVFHPPTC